MPKAINPVGAAIRRLRDALGDTQAKFAKRLGTTPRTIIRWEQGETPRDNALVSLEQLAGPWADCATVFRLAREGQSAELGPSVRPDNTPRDFDESKAIHAFLDVWRNPTIYPREHKAVQRAIAKSRSELEKDLEQAQAARDAQQFVIRLLDRGQTAQEIANRLEIPLKHVKTIEMAHRIHQLLHSEDDQE